MNDMGNSNLKLSQSNTVQVDNEKIKSNEI